MILELPMQPLAVDLRIIRSLLAPEMKVVPGRALMARVAVADGSGRGSLSIAGFLIDAELPKNVRAGADLRLVVRDVNSERVLLTISDQPQTAAQTAAAPDQQQAAQTAGLTTPPPPMMVPLPGGGTMQVVEREAGTPNSSSPEAQTLTLRYDAPALGAVDLRLELDPGSLRVGVSVAPSALEPARAGVAELREALSAAMGRPISVTVTPRREPLDLYA
jgi:hypothetical protein